MPKRQGGAVKTADLPDWIKDPADQKEWNGRFVKILRRADKNLDSTISAILDNEKLAQMCATKIRSYVDTEVTGWLYAKRKARGAEHKKKLETALPGLNAAASIYAARGNDVVVTHLTSLATELSEQLERCKIAFSTKRLGRDRAHSTLINCRLYLESELKHAVTNATLASLVSAGLEANGDAKHLVTEENIRKNLSSFRRNNPWWRNTIATP